ncbi:MATE family efflux transporter [Bifidobacterium platyrrhinorum]|uniref:MATE family efflux transporter n=1 Tax=Bifidobacterium platyrrhinorum TaxID=2661628 RepID=A0A6L9SSX3_9BIFI|nr:MATE family efflux transporter [Bifidobacterium platyrrhinorum]NEG54923.1 MATE family efflux transporter [Bifidobacterium platyrrhinorum]
MRDNGHTHDGDGLGTGPGTTERIPRDPHSPHNPRDPRAGGDIRRIMALALPTFGQLIAEPAFILIDTAIVGHIGDAALAGLSIGSTIVLTTVGLCVFLAYGTTSQVARLIGAGRRREGLEAGVDGMWLALIIGVAVSCVLFACGRPLCAALGARGDVLVQARHYLNAIVFGLPGMLLVYAANGIFRGLGRVRVTLVAAVMGAVVNTALELLFVLGFGWGIIGSGAATLIAQWFMGVFLTVPALLWAKAEGASIRPHLNGILGSAGDGLPLFLRSLALRACLVATVMLAARMGVTVLAAYQAVNASWNFVLNMLDAVGIAGQALVATELGAGRRAEARAMARTAGGAGAAAGMVIGLGFAATGLAAAPLFSPNAAVQALIVAGMVTQGLFLPLCGWMWALDGILIGAGDYRYLAATCTLTAVVYMAVLAGVDALDGTAALATPIARMIALWAVLNVVFIGLRALFNGLRAHGDAWLAKV